MVERYSAQVIRGALESEIARLRPMLTTKEEGLLRKIESARDQDKSRTRDDAFRADVLDLIKRTLDKREDRNDG